VAAALSGMFDLCLRRSNATPDGGYVGDDDDE
jgi:hypothetical protein